MRWRTHNRFAAPMVLRIPVGFFKCGDPWHSQTNEVQFVHNPGWLVAAPSNAEDAVGLLRSALRGNDPTVFFEHRAMLDDPWARRPYPGDDYVLPFGRAKKVREGDEISLITWGAMVPRCEQAVQQAGVSADVIDLRTLMPWDRETVLESVRRTRRCLIVHEDLRTGGFGAEIAAVVADLLEPGAHHRLGAFLLDGNQDVDHQNPTSSSIFALIFSTDGTAESSSTGLCGLGMSGMVSRAIGASRSRKASSATTAAISAPKPPVRRSS